MAMRAARFPARKSLADVDVSFQPSVTREQLERLHPLNFLTRHDNVAFMGPHLRWA